MIEEEIVEGLGLAMSKGETLMKAMMSFYNAGYSREVVEEAARLLNQPSLRNIQTLAPKTPAPKAPVQAQASTPKTPVQVQTPIPQTPKIQPVQEPPKQYVSQPVSQYGSQQPVQILPQVLPAPIPSNPQTVSYYYEKNKHPFSTGIMILLSIILFFLLSALVYLIVFKDVVAKFFGSLL